jgi:hypothetical protein
MLDAKLPDGVRRYWKAFYLDELTDEAIDIIVVRSLGMPSKQTLVFLRHVSGAVGRVPAGATAFGDRRAQFMLSGPRRKYVVASIRRRLVLVPVGVRGRRRGGGGCRGRCG